VTCLNPSDNLTDLNGVSHDVLIFEDDVKAGDDIANQILCAKADGQAGEPRKSGDGRKR